MSLDLYNTPEQEQLRQQWRGTLPPLRARNWTLCSAGSLLAVGRQRKDKKSVLRTCTPRTILYFRPMKATKRPAHTVKPGDTVNGVEVFDTLRAGFGGHYIPLVDGTRITVRRTTNLVTTR